MKKYFSLLLVPIVAFSFVWLVAISVPVQAQTTAIQTQSWAATQCPVGYTCQQMNQTTLPVCPAGLTCTPMTTAAATCYTFTRNLGKDKPFSTQEAAALTYVLSNEGIWNANVPIVTYDDIVASAVSKFQEKHSAQTLSVYGLSQGTGNMGVSTRAEMNRLYGCQQTQVATTVPVYTPTPSQTPVSTNAQSSITTTQCPVGYTCQQMNQTTLPVCPAGLTCTPMTTAATQTQSWAATQCPVGYTCQQMNQTTLPVCPAGLTCTPMTTTAVPSQPAVVNYTPTIISVNGTTPLVVGEAGSWTIQASDPQNGPLTYSVDWGDSTSLSTSVSTSRSNTLYHTYASVGAYTPTFTVTDSDGLKAASSILVQVSASITTAAAFVPPAVAIGAIGAPVFTVTTQGNTTGYTAATFPMTFTVTSGTMPVYISATPASAVVLSSYVPGSLTSNLLPASNVSAVSLDGGAAVSGDTNQGSGPQATGSYIVPAGATRTFTVNVKLNNAGNGSVVSNAVTGISAIYYSQNSTPAGSVTAKYLESPFTSNLGNVQTPPVTLLGIGNQ